MPGQEAPLPGGGTGAGRGLGPGGRWFSGSKAPERPRERELAAPRARSCPWIYSTYSGLSPSPPSAVPLGEQPRP